MTLNRTQTLFCIPEQEGQEVGILFEVKSRTRRTFENVRWAVLDNVRVTIRLANEREQKWFDKTKK